MEENVAQPKNDEKFEDDSLEAGKSPQNADNVEVSPKNAKHMEEDSLKDEEDILGNILNSVDSLSEQMNQMNSLFIAKIQHTTHEEKIVDQMHTELQKYKDDMYSQLVRPILRDLIEVRDSILRMAKNYSIESDKEQRKEPSVPLKVFSGYSFDIQDILEKNNISIYEDAKETEFIPGKHRVIKKVETTFSHLHGKIAEVISPGYDYMGKTISPEKVALYVYKEPQAVKGEDE